MIMGELARLLHEAETQLEKPCAVCTFTTDLQKELSTLPQVTNEAILELLKRKSGDLARQETDLSGQVQSVQHTIEHLTLELEHYKKALETYTRRRDEVKKLRKFSQLVFDRVVSHYVLFDTKVPNANPEVPRALEEGGVAAAAPAGAATLVPRTGPVGEADGPTEPPTEEHELARCLGFITLCDSARPLPPDAVQHFLQFVSNVVDVPLSPQVLERWQQMILAVYGALKNAPPTLQTPFLHILADALTRMNSFAPAEEDAARTGAGPGGSIWDTLVAQNAFGVLNRLLNSLNNSVRSEAAAAICALCATNALKDQYGRTNGISVLVSILNKSPSEVVVEKVLTCVWTLAMTDHNKGVIRQVGGLQTVVNLLYINSEKILDAATIALGYLTRDDGNKIAIRDCNGIEKLLATLYFPSESIQSKAAGALWNCASNAENKAAIRELGGIAPMIELLSSKVEAVQENVAGGLWNCAVDADNKRLVRDLGGLNPLIRLLSSPSEAVVENVSGTLWNCTALGENRVALRKLDGLRPLLGLLQHPNDNIQDNAAGAIRNSAINDQNKVSFRELGGLKLFLELLDTVRTSVLEKLTSTLWICSINPENKMFISEAGGFPTLLNLVRSPNLSICEKALGILRNCSSLPANYLALYRAGVLPVLLEVLCKPDQPHTVREYTVATIWNACRADEARAEAVRMEIPTHILRLLAEYIQPRGDGRGFSPMISVLENLLGALSVFALSSEVRPQLATRKVLGQAAQALTLGSDSVTESAAALFGALMQPAHTEAPAVVQMALQLEILPPILRALHAQCPPGQPQRIREGLLKETLATMQLLAEASEQASTLLSRAEHLSSDLQWISDRGPDAAKQRAQALVQRLASGTAEGDEN
eukprot:TRINITY_DN7193_c0_g1_i1.p1 TRINITY_DN7193_c0_g1~~TRINITY_DN7193_c0_g1_i1.p1  ORF type:complete len:881 (-),score=218.46 TRINITY_DN7193_c0_g1_i1:613-3255(-)